jgi:catechol 2,3-dioxygenase-like lactoylglutathione lyase family enzyme
MKFGHIGIDVLDMEKSLVFYQSALSAKVIKDYVYTGCRLVFLDVGGTIIELVGMKNNHVKTPGPIDHIAFKVDNLEEKMQLLIDLGIPYTKPQEVGTAKVIFFDGPNNEKFEFVAKI